MVEFELPKLAARVRFPSPAPFTDFVLRTRCLAVLFYG
jgi:hypothetical protein